MAWHRTSRHARGYGTAWDKLRIEIFKRDDFLCQRCADRNIVREGRICDHRVPKALGGSDDPSNLRTLCGECDYEVGLEQRGKKPRPRIGPDGFPTEAPKRPKLTMLRPRIKPL